MNSSLSAHTHKSHITHSDKWEQLLTELFSPDSRAIFIYIIIETLLKQAYQPFSYSLSQILVNCLPELDSAS